MEVVIPNLISGLRIILSFFLLLLVVGIEISVVCVSVLEELVIMSTSEKLDRDRKWR